MFPSCCWCRRVRSRGDCWNSMERQHFTRSPLPTDAVRAVSWRRRRYLSCVPGDVRKRYIGRKNETKRFTLLDSLSGRGRSSNLLHTAHTAPSSVRLYMRLALLSCNGFYWTSSTGYWRHTASWAAIMALAFLRQTSSPARLISAAQ